MFEMLIFKVSVINNKKQQQSITKAVPNFFNITKKEDFGLSASLLKLAQRRRDFLAEHHM